MPFHSSAMSPGTTASLRQPTSSKALDDEYANMDKNDSIFEAGTFKLESGLELHKARVAYRAWGTLNAARDNAIFIAHALTGNADAKSWWGVLFGEGQPFNTSKYFVVCANMLGSCYGTTGPLDEMPTDPSPSWVAPRKGTARERAGARYAADFPYCTIRDTVGLHYNLLRHLGIEALHAVVGGSAGGMQALEWAIMHPHFVRRVVSIACGATQSAFQIGISESQRQAIYRDSLWNDGFYSLSQTPAEGLSVARQQAMIWYRSQQAYDSKFGREYTACAGTRGSPHGIAHSLHAARGGSAAGAPPTFAVEGYLEYQGQKFIERFDANTYVALTRLIDSHDVGRGRGGIDAALRRILSPVLIIGISSDLLYPIEMQRDLASRIPRGTLRIVTSLQGHDGFLLEGMRIGALVNAALDTAPEEEISTSASTSDDEGGTPRDRSLRQTASLPRTQDAMNVALALSKMTRHSPMLSPAQEWFFGI
jgi:homoserine O-acetyltransferase